MIVSKVCKGQWMAILASLWCQELKPRCFHGLLRAFLTSLRDIPTRAVSKCFSAPIAFGMTAPPPEMCKDTVPMPSLLQQLMR